MANPNPPRENLIPFEPGKSGNPRGNYKGTEHSSTRLKRLLHLTQNLANPITGEKEDFTVLEQIDIQMIQKARAGDLKAINLLLDRLEGKPKESIDHTTLGKELPSPILGGISKKTDK